MSTVFQRAKTAVLPSGTRPRTIPVGMGRGVRMNIDFAHQTRQYLGFYEIEIAPHIKRLARRGLTSFDIGAQDGYDALILANLTGSRVASFESDAVHVERNMAENFALNPRLARQITAVHAEVGNGAAQLGVDEWAFGPNGFVPDIVKIDVEGGEGSVLASAARVLATAPSLIVEVHSIAQEEECLAMLASAGYRTTIVDQRRFLPDHRPAEHNRWVVAEADN